MKVQSVDYGWYFTVPLSSLCELPQSLKDMPPQVMKANLAGLQRDSALTTVMAVNKLQEVKERKQVIAHHSCKKQHGEGGGKLVKVANTTG